MSSQLCSRCLVRASRLDSLASAIPSTSRTPQSPSFTQSFTTSGSLFATPLKKKPLGFLAGNKKPERGQKLTFTKKKRKTVVDTSKRPAIGERKALRKRVVLSNTNALRVTDMQDFSQEIVTGPSPIGKVLAIPDDLVDRLRAVQAFKPSQGWSLFSRPAMVVRPETLEYDTMMQEAVKQKKAVRRIIVGERMTGKTVMLLQVMALAMLKNWVVISIPDAMDLTIANTDYAPYPNPTTQPLQYAQPSYTASLLLSISRANPILQTLKLSSQPSSSDPNSTLPSIPPEISLAHLCQLGAETPDSAWPIFQLLLSELKQPNRPPIAFVLDGLDFAMRETNYIDPKHYKPIHAHSLLLLSTFFSHLSGTSSLPNGGIVLGAISESNRPNVETLRWALEQIEEKGELVRDAYRKDDERVLDVFQGPDGHRRGIEVQRLGGLGKEECRALMEYWAKSGILRGRVAAPDVHEKWGLAGGGVVGELERACCRPSF